MLCVGDLMLELFVSVESPSKKFVSLLDYGQAELGGSVRNVGHYLAALGRSVRAVAVVPAAYAPWCKTQLAASGLSADHLYFFGTLLDYLIVCARGEPFKGIYLREELPSAEYDRLVHAHKNHSGKVLAVLGSRRHSVRSLSTKLARGGRFERVVFSPSYPLMDYSVEDVAEALGWCDVLIVNELEQLYLSSLFPKLEEVLGVKRAARKGGIPRRPPLVVTTLAGSGARLLLDGRSWQVPAFSRSLDDVVGAGDAFTAGFIDALLDELSPMHAMLRAGCASALMVDAQRMRAQIGRDDFRADRFAAARLALERLAP